MRAHTVCMYVFDSHIFLTHKIVIDNTNKSHKWMEIRSQIRDFLREKVFIKV